MDGADLPGEDFWESPNDADAVHVVLPEQQDGGEPPALRTLSRPPSWNAPSAPTSALAGLYTSAQRRATEVLRPALAANGDEPEGDEDRDDSGVQA